MQTAEEIEKELLMGVPVGAIFRHYKGHYYKVLLHARHSDSLEMQVIYMSLYADEVMGDYAIWARPLWNFSETVLIEGQEVRRFCPVNRFGE